MLSEPKGGRAAGVGDRVGAPHIAGSPDPEALDYTNLINPDRGPNR
jgi:hypothetical protein